MRRWWLVCEPTDEPALVRVVAMHGTYIAAQNALGEGQRLLPAKRGDKVGDLRRVHIWPALDPAMWQDPDAPVDLAAARDRGSNPAGLMLTLSAEGFAAGLAAASEPFTVPSARELAENWTTEDRPDGSVVIRARGFLALKRVLSLSRSDE